MDMDTKTKVKLGLAVALVVIAGIVFGQNSNNVPVKFLWIGPSDMPLSLLLIITFLIGGIAGWALTAFLRYRKSKTL